MKVKVKMMVGGTIIEDIVIVDKFSNAAPTAKARNPTAKVIAVNVIF